MCSSHAIGVVFAGWFNYLSNKKAFPSVCISITGNARSKIDLQTCISFGFWMNTQSGNETIFLVNAVVKTGHNIPHMYIYHSRCWQNWDIGVLNCCARLISNVWVAITFITTGASSSAIIEGVP